MVCGSRRCLHIEPEIHSPKKPRVSPPASTSSAQAASSSNPSPPKAVHPMFAKKPAAIPKSKEVKRTSEEKPKKKSPISKEDVKEKIDTASLKGKGKAVASAAAADTIEKEQDDKVMNEEDDEEEMEMEEEEEQDSKVRTASPSSMSRLVLTRYFDSHCRPQRSSPPFSRKTSPRRIPTIRNGLRTLLFPMQVRLSSI